MCLPGFHIPFCTEVLKQKPAENFYKELDKQGVDYTIYNGLGIEEWRRVQRSVVRAEAKGRKLRCLLAERNISDKEVKRAIRDDWKICLPEPYKYLKHNNCIPCFKAGKGHFYKVWRHYPERFERAKQMEELVGHTVFKDKSLSELEAEWIASGEQLELDFGEEGVPCMCAV